MIVCLLVSGHGVQQATVVDRGKSLEEFLRTFGPPRGSVEKREKLLDTGHEFDYGWDLLSTNQQRRYYFDVTSITSALELYELVAGSG